MIFIKLSDKDVLLISGYVYQFCYANLENDYRFADSEFLYQCCKFLPLFKTLENFTLILCYPYYTVLVCMN